MNRQCIANAIVDAMNNGVETEAAFRVYDENVVERDRINRPAGLTDGPECFYYIVFDDDSMVLAVPQGGSRIDVMALPPGHPRIAEIRGIIVNALVLESINNLVRELVIPEHRTIN